MRTFLSYPFSFYLLLLHPSKVPPSSRLHTCLHAHTYYHERRCIFHVPPLAHCTGLKSPEMYLHFQHRYHRSTFPFRYTSVLLCSMIITRFPTLILSPFQHLSPYTCSLVSISSSLIFSLRFLFLGTFSVSFSFRPLRRYGTLKVMFYWPRYLLNSLLVSLFEELLPACALVIEMGRERKRKATFMDNQVEQRCRVLSEGAVSEVSGANDDQWHIPFEIGNEKINGTIFN